MIDELAEYTFDEIEVGLQKKFWIMEFKKK